MRKNLVAGLLLALAGCSSNTVEEPVLQAVEDAAPQSDDVHPIDAMTAVLDRNPADTAALTQRGNEWFQLGDYERTIEDYTASLTLSKNARTYYNRAVAYTSKDDLARAAPITTPPSSSIHKIRPPISIAPWCCTKWAKRRTASRT